MQAHNRSGRPSRRARSPVPQSASKRRKVGKEQQAAANVHQAVANVEQTSNSPVVPASSSSGPSKPAVPPYDSRTSNSPVVPASSSSGPSKPVIPLYDPYERSEQTSNSPVVPASSSSGPSKPVIPLYDPYENSDEWYSSSGSDFENNESDSDERGRRFFEIKKLLRRKIHNAKQAKKHDYARTLEEKLRQNDKDHFKFLAGKEARKAKKAAESRVEPSTAVPDEISDNASSGSVSPYRGPRPISVLPPWNVPPWNSPTWRATHRVVPRLLPPEPGSMWPNRSQKGSSPVVRSELDSRERRLPPLSQQHPVTARDDASRGAVSTTKVLQGKVRVWSTCHEYIYKALNVDWVPEPCPSLVELNLRCDGRFGPADPLHWPQQYCPEQPHWALVPRRPKRLEEPAAILWDVPTLLDFEGDPNSAGRGHFGCIKKAKVDSLTQAVRSLDAARKAFRVTTRDRMNPASSSTSTDLHMDAHEAIVGERTRYYEETLGQLSRLEARLEYALTMFQAPTSYRDCVVQWAHLHRTWAELWAWLEWHKLRRLTSPDTPNPLHPGLDGEGIMGVFCHETKAAIQLFALGIPVWQICAAVQEGDHDTVHRAGSLKTPKDVPQLTDGMPDRKKVVSAGMSQFITIADMSSRLVDYSTVTYNTTAMVPEEELLQSLTMKSGSRIVKSHSGSVRGKERFAEKKHALLPRRVEAWQKALDQVDFSKPSPDDQERLGLFMPEAEILVAVNNPMRLFVYLCNWLESRTLVMRLLHSEHRFAPPRPPVWRVLLERFPPQEPQTNVSASSSRQVADAPSRKHTSKPKPKKRQEKEDGCRLFSALFDQEITLERTPVEAITWRAMRLEKKAFEGESVPQRLVAPIREIAWELAEMGFRMDLYEADRRMVAAHPPPAVDGQARASAQDEIISRRNLLTNVWGDGHYLYPTLPPCPTMGLSADSLEKRASGLEGLRQVFVRWPSHPALFDETGVLSSQSSKDTLEQFEHAASAYYCQTFYQQFGRAPAVPRIHPS